MLLRARSSVQYSKYNVGMYAALILSHNNMHRIVCNVHINFAYASNGFTVEYEFAAGFLFSIVNMTLEFKNAPARHLFLQT